MTAQLAEVPQLAHIHVFIAGQVQYAIEQHGTMAGGQDETVPVGPVRLIGIKL